MLIQNMLWYAETYSWQRADILLTVSSSFDVSIIAIQTGVWSSEGVFRVCGRPQSDVCVICIR